MPSSNDVERYVKEKTCDCGKGKLNLCATRSKLTGRLLAPRDRALTEYCPSCRQESKFEVHWPKVRLKPIFERIDNSKRIAFLQGFTRRKAMTNEEKIDGRGCLYFIMAGIAAWITFIIGVFYRDEIWQWLKVMF